MGTSQSYSVSAPLSKSPLSFAQLESPLRENKPYLRKEEGQMKRKTVRGLYSKEEAAQKDCLAQGGYQTPRSVTRPSPVIRRKLRAQRSPLSRRDLDAYKKMKVTRKKMDDYTDPKDAKKFVWDSLKSQQFEEEEDEERYSEPYQHVPGPNGPVWRTSSQPAPLTDDIYELAVGPDTANTINDYDVPPSAVDDYSHLGSMLPKAANSRIVPSKDEPSDSDDSYSHTSTWVAQKTERQNSDGLNHSNSPVPDGITTKQNTHRQDSNGSVSGTDSVTLRNVSGSHSHSQDGQTRFSRQRVIYPRKGSSSMAATSGVGSEPAAGPPLYEEAWDLAQQQKKLQEKMQLARSISSTSDKFEDAVEYLPEESAPTRQKSGGRKPEATGGGGVGGGGSGRKTDPVTGGTYEEAWDLNRGLEEKLRSLNLMRPETDVGGEGNYIEPWDTAKKQRELEEKIHQARTGGGGSQNQRASHQPQGAVYEDAWDTKKSLSQILQSSQSNEGHGSSRSSQSTPFSIGEPVNAMIPLKNQDWYHGNISRDDAEKLLRVCKDGSYLVRDSSDRCHFTLSIKSAIQTIHIQIDQCQKPDGSMRYILGKNSKAFETIPAMIDHYTRYPVPIKGASHMTLLYPVQCHWSQADETRM